MDGSINNDGRLEIFIEIDDIFISMISFMIRLRKWIKPQPIRPNQYQNNKSMIIISSTTPFIYSKHKIQYLEGVL